MPSDHSMPRLPDTSVTPPPIPPIDADRSTSPSCELFHCPTSFFVHTSCYSTNVSLHPVVTFFLSAVFTSILFILHRFSAEFCIHIFIIPVNGLQHLFPETRSTCA